MDLLWALVHGYFEPAAVYHLLWGSTQQMLTEASSG